MSDSLQVGEPLLLLKKMLCKQTVPELSDLRKLLRNCQAMYELSEALSQGHLEACLGKIMSYLGGWFDFKEDSHVGILLPGNEELDRMKEEYAELPGLLKKVRNPRESSRFCQSKFVQLRVVIWNYVITDLPAGRR
jgi:hypothetical protein